MNLTIRALFKRFERLVPAWKEQLDREERELEANFVSYFGVTPTEGARLFQLLANQTCPQCGASDDDPIRELAEGGAALNVICNHCQARFWTDRTAIAHPLPNRSIN